MAAKKTRSGAAEITKAIHASRPVVDVDVKVGAESTVPTIAPEPEAVSNDIDSRMDALLKDHQRMGARPR